MTFVTLIYKQIKRMKIFDFFNAKKSYENVSAEAFRKLYDEHSGGVILDVRTNEEFIQGAIHGAVNLDLIGGTFKHEIAKMDKEKTYFVYCRSGNRSGQACKLMSDLGFRHLYNLSGGIMSFSL